MSDARKDLPPITAPNFLEKVREAVQTYLGNRGDRLDRGLTLRDLADAGIVDVSPRYLASGGTSPVVGAGTAITAVYESDLTPPPVPTGFTATAAISNIMLSCDAATYTQGHGHAKTRLYGATWESGPLPVFSNAVLLTEFSGNIGSYATNPATTWHLWLTWMTVDGVESTVPAGGTNGVVVKTGQDVTAMVAAMTGAGKPFTVLTTSTVINGVTFPAGIYSTNAFIQDLQVTNAKIADLAVDDGKVFNLSATKLTVGDGTVGGNLKSSNYVANTSGWIVQPGGYAEYNNIVVRGTVYANAGQIGGITVESNAVRAGQTAYNSGTGFHLGSDGRVSFGNSAGNKLTWDNSALAIAGALAATSISTNSGKFSVNSSGIMSATDGYFSGTLAAGTVDFASSVGYTTNYPTPGTYTLTVPANMVRLRYVLYGAGGGGGGGSSRAYYTYGGGGGGAGAFATGTVTVTPGQTLTLVVGANGAPGGAIDPETTDPALGGYQASSNGQAGGSTYITGVVTAAGGAGGSSPWIGGAGGAIGGAAGTVTGCGGIGGSSAMGVGGAGGVGTMGGGSTPGGDGGVAAGGGGGGVNGATNTSGMVAGSGGPGYAVIEFFDPSGVVLKAPFDVLKAELRAQGHTLS